MRKVLSMMLIGVMAVGMLTGCGGDSNTAGTTQAAGKDAITIEHQEGKTVIDGKVKKAVIFDLATLDSVDALGVDVELAVPTDSLPEYLSKYSDAVNAGGIKEPDLEAIFAFEPDVIFMSGRQAEYYDQLNEIAPTIYVGLEAETYMEDFENNAKMVAAIFDKEAEAEVLLAETKEKVEEVKTLAASKEDKALIILTNDGSISAYGAGSRFGIIHDVLGVKTADGNIEASTHGQEASYEYVSQTNPDILFVVDRTVVVGGTNTAETTLDNDLINSTNAAKNKKIVSLNPDTWYLSGGGLTSVKSMVEEVEAGLK